MRNLLDLWFLGVCFFKRGAKSLRQLNGIVVRPKMHEIKVWLIAEHVIVHGLDFNPMHPQARITGLTSPASRTKSPEIAALPPPVG